MMVVDEFVKRQLKRLRIFYEDDWKEWIIDRAKNLPQCMCYIIIYIFIYIHFL